MVAVVGGGAAGLMAAIFAAAKGAAVVLIERTADGGRKILISGGGRCNVLPSVLAPERFVTDSPSHLMRGMLRSWPLREQRAFFESDLGIPLALEQESGKLFPRSNRARDVRAGLIEAARTRGVHLRFGTAVTGIDRTTTGFSLQTSSGQIAADRVVIATGGLSVPQTGSDGAGLRMMQALDHRVTQTYPALTPLLGTPDHAALSGLSLSVRLRGKTNGGTLETSGGFLFTHRGYSGPSVLDMSHLVTRASPAGIRVQWAALSGAEWTTAFESSQGQVASVMAAHLPRRLADQLMIEAGVPPDRRTSGFRKEERGALIERLTSYQLPINGDEGFKKAEVTGGGVALDEIDSLTLESRRCRGLFICGEILDAFGPIGGHNFAWAWATGRAAGLAAGGST